MRVTIDAIPLLLRSAGVKTYVYHWMRHLIATSGDHQLDVFPFLKGPWGDDGCVHQRSVLGESSTFWRLGLLFVANRSPVPILNPIGSRTDIFHASHQLRRPPHNTRLTATLYDMTCWIAPEVHTAANVAGTRRFADAVLKRAVGLIAISETTRSDTIRILGIPPERIEVIYPGVTGAYFDAAPMVRKKPYILFVGTIEPRKNVDVLLDAYLNLSPELREEYDLVIAGPSGWGDPGALRRLKSGLPGVEYMGYVLERDLPGLTAGAAAFVYPSLYEGFGLPVAQAMAAGAPVITSNVSSLPEICGDGALLVDPRSAGELGSAIQKLLLSPTVRSELSANGVRRAQMYRWENCARQSWRFFERIAGQ